MRTALAIGLLLALFVIGCDAPDDQGTPVQTPTPQVIQMQEASPQQEVQSACAELGRTESFDLTIHAKDNTTQDTLITSVSVQGDDFSGSLTFSGQGTWAEFIRANGVDYYREGTGAWAASNARFSDVGRILPGVGDNPVCPDTSNFVAAGDEVLDGVKVKRYADPEPLSTTFADVDTAFRGGKSRRENVVWITSDGQLAQFQSTIHVLTQTDAERRVDTTVQTTTISGIGETNTITAPVVP